LILAETKCLAAFADRRGRLVSRRTLLVNLSSSRVPVREIRQLARDLGKEAKDCLVGAVGGARVWLGRRSECARAGGRKDESTFVCSIDRKCGNTIGYS
jgi:hypothetical protein